MPQRSAALGENAAIVPIPVTVRDDTRTSAYLRERMGAFPPDTELIMYFFITDARVYGRVVEARLNGKAYPICMDLWEPPWDSNNNRTQHGLPRQPGGDEDHAVILNQFSVRAVSRFP